MTYEKFCTIIEHMIVWPELSDEQHEPRAHPWKQSDFEGGGDYCDFKTSPHLISEALEDFKPYASYQAIQTFYDYLGWLNGAESRLESNDCAFRGADENLDIGLSKKKLRCCGRLELFFRYLPANVYEPSIRYLIKSLFIELCKVNPLFTNGFIEIGTRPTPYLALRAAGTEYNGKRIYIHFCSYGDTTGEAFDNLNVLFGGLFTASKNISAQIPDQGDA